MLQLSLKVYNSSKVLKLKRHIIGQKNKSRNNQVNSQILNDKVKNEYTSNATATLKQFHMGKVIKPLTGGLHDGRFKKEVDNPFAEFTSLYV